MRPESTVDVRVNPGRRASVVLVLGMLALACNPPVVPESAEPVVSRNSTVAYLREENRNG